MNLLKNTLSLLAQIVRHPNNRSWPLGGVFRFVGWQIWKRIVRRPLTIRVGANRRFLAVPDPPFSSQVIYNRLPDWDEMNFLLRYLRREDRFLDLGANVGFYTVLASTIIDLGEIFPIEANPSNTAILRRQLEINHLKNVKVSETAASNIDGTVRFSTATREMGSILHRPNNDPDTLEVPCQRLDTLLVRMPGSGDAIDLAKMDVEGCEMLVLEGAADTLKRKVVQTWLFEVNDHALRNHGSTARDLLNTFTQHGYSLYAWDETTRELKAVAFDATMGHLNLIACLNPVHMKNRLGLLE